MTRRPVPSGLHCCEVEMCGRRDAEAQRRKRTGFAFPLRLRVSAADSSSSASQQCRTLRTPHSAIRTAVLIAILLTIASPAIQAATLTLESTALSYTAGGGALVLSPGAVLSGADFSAGSPLAITMAFTANRVDGEDLLQIRASGGVTVAAGVVSVGGVAIGPYSGGSGATPLIITITPGSDAGLVQTLIRHLAYHDLAGSGATAGSRTIQISVSDQSGTSSASRSVVVGPGNAVPALTIGGTLTVPRTARVAIGPTALLATDGEDAAHELVYELGSLPQYGTLLLATIDGNGDLGGSVVLGGGLTTFTQADIDAGRLRYDHQGDPSASDGFTVLVRDSDDAATPLSAVSIAITGAQVGGTITLPGGALTCTEQGSAQAMDPAAPATLTVSVVEADARHYRRAELVVRLVDGAGAAAATSGDVLGVRDATGQIPDATRTGYVCVVGSSIYIRHTAGSDPLPTVGGTQDRLLGVIDATDHGAAGRALRIILEATVDQVIGDQALPAGDVLISEQEVVTPAAVAHLIANLTLKHPGQDPPAVARFIDLTLSEATPNPGTTNVRRAITVVPVNDRPRFDNTLITMSAVVGTTAILGVAASDPDLPEGQSLTYRLAAAVTGVALDATSGALHWIPPDTTPVDIDVIAQDDQGADSLPLRYTITPLAAPTSARPYIVSDAPVELGGGELIFHPFTIVPAVGSGVPIMVTVTVVGDAPAGALATVASLDQLSWTLTAPAVTRPADGIHTFGLHVQVTSSSGTDIGYQPMTLVVLDLAGSN